MGTKVRFYLYEFVSDLSSYLIGFGAVREPWFFLGNSENGEAYGFSFLVNSSYEKEEYLDFIGGYLKKRNLEYDIIKEEFFRGEDWVGNISFESEVEGFARILFAKNPPRKEKPQVL